MRLVLVKLALLGFLCRALVPVGFMPAALADGGPFSFCHGGPAGALLTALVERRLHDASPETHAEARTHAHDQSHPTDPASTPAHGASLAEQQHDHTHDASHQGWDRCPVGTAFSFAVLAADVDLPLLALAHAFEPPPSDAPILGVLPPRYRARAPPLV